MRAQIYTDKKEDRDMKLTASQLRKIIAEEVRRTLSEAPGMKIQLVNGGVYTNAVGDTITVTHLDKYSASFMESTAGGVDFEDEETTPKELTSTLTKGGFRLTRMLDNGF